MDLQAINFGALAAERDEALKSYFIESESYFRLRDGQRTVLLGNRGVGKSAIFRMIATHESSQNSVVIQLAPEDYSYELFQQILVSEKAGSWAKQGAYASAWKYLIYILVMKHLVSAKRGLKTGSEAKIYSYLRDNHSNFDVNPIGVFISYLKRLESIKLGSHEVGIKSRELYRLYKLEEINELLPALQLLCSERRVVVLIDELDRGWDASEDAVAFVSGLFQAVISIKSHTPNLRVLISLRKELYDNIPALYEDAQKVRDLIEEIEWDESQLFSLIVRRIGASHDKQLHGNDEQELWKLIFSETLDYRNTQSFNYIVDRTLYRPREIIQFCTEIKTVALKLKNAPPLNYSVISEAEYSYSEERLQDIAAEYRFQYPGLVSVFETFRGGPYTFMRDALEYHCLQMAVGDIRVDASAKAWISEIEEEELIDIFWRIGFIRAQAVGGIRARQRSGSRYLGSHQVSNLNLQTVTRFHIHPMFRSALGLKEKTATLD